MRLIIFVVVFVAIFTSCNVHADEKTELSTQYQNCMNQSGGVTVAMRDCIANEYELQDKRLNEEYNALRGQVSKEWGNRLLKAQRLWIQFRDTNCKLYEMQYEGGAVAPIMSADCALQMTAIRATELANFIQKEESAEIASSDNVGSPETGIITMNGFSGKDGHSIVISPKLRPDEDLYAISGSIALAEDGETVFLGEVEKWNYDGLIPIKEFGYVGVKIPKELQDYYFNNARINGKFDLVGIYVDNTKYQTVDGQEKTAPVLEAIYFVIK